MTATIMNTVKRVFAVLVLAASIPVTAATDVCADYRAAIAVREAAVDAARTFEGSPPWPYDINDKSPEAQAWFNTKRSLHQSFDRAYAEARKARFAVIASIEDENVLRVIDDIESLIGPLVALDSSVSAWQRSEMNRIGWLASKDVFRAVEDGVYAINTAMRNARHQALLATCVLATMLERRSKP